MPNTGSIPLFKPLEHPTPRVCFTQASVKFEESSKEYEFEIDAKNSGPEVNMAKASYKGSISRSLVETLLSMEKFGEDVKTFEELTDDHVKTLVRDLAAKKPAVPDSDQLEALVSKVQMKTYNEEPQAEARVLDVFHRYNRASEAGSYKEPSKDNPKTANKLFVTRISPTLLREKKNQLSCDQ